MTWVAAAVVGAAAIGAVGSNIAAKKGAKAQTGASNDAISFQRESLDKILGLQAPYRNASYAATAALMDMTGLQRPEARKPLGYAEWLATQPGGGVAAPAKKKKKGLLGTLLNPTRSVQAIVDPVGATIGATKDVYGYAKGGSAASSADPQAGYQQYLESFKAEPDLGSYKKYEFTADPGYAFRLAEGNKAIEHSASARGGLLSGAATKSALRYAQDYASEEYKNVYNRIAGIAGFGQVATNASTGAIQDSSTMTGRAILNAGDARASSYIAQGNAWSNALSQVGMYAGYRMGG